MNRRNEPLVEASDLDRGLLAASRSPLAAMLERAIAGVGPRPGASMVAVSGGDGRMCLALAFWYGFLQTVFRGFVN